VIFIYLFRVVFLPLFFPKEEMADPEALKHMIMIKLVRQKPLQTKHVHVPPVPGQAEGSGFGTRNLGLEGCRIPSLGVAHSS
jgi:hypothetical protein